MSGRQATPSASSSNAGGWFEAQLGCSLWMLIFGPLSLAKNPLTAWVALVGFAMVNARGWSLWRSRSGPCAYAGLQRLLRAVSIV